MNITFRVDDVSLYMNWDRFRALVRLFEKHGIKPLIGVIPDNRDSELTKLTYNTDGWKVFRELKECGWLTAQHGYRHVYTTKDPGLLGVNPYSEFAGLDEAAQLDMLSQGKKLLADTGLESDIFMAPAHSYDRNTLKALSKLGFRYVTDGYSIFPYRRQGLKFIPCQTSKPVKAPAGIITVCLHPNTMEENDFIVLDKWISENRTYVCDYREALTYKSLGIISKAVEKPVLLLRRVKKRRAAL
jgi:predicted deacetylase